MSNDDPIKDILRLFHYGLFVATSPGPAGIRAATISWVTQVSFAPRLILVALRKGTAICEAVQGSRLFGLHVVGAHQPEFARAFFTGTQATGEEIAGYRYRLTARQVPILEAAPAWLECEVVEEAGTAGDHALFVAAILDGDIAMPGTPALALRDTVWHYGG